jgi:uncharacterized membrane protein
VLLFSFVLLIHVPNMIHSILTKPQDIRVLWSSNGTGGVNNALKDLTLSISALLLGAAQSSAGRGPRSRSVIVLGKLFALMMVLFGVEHFFYTGYTPGIPSWSLVSFWIPWGLFWGYATGAFLLLGGAMILIGKRARLAATALGIMILLTVVLTYAFRVAAGLGNLGELTNMLKDIAVAGGALILSETFPPFTSHATTASQAVHFDATLSR